MMNEVNEENEENKEIENDEDQSENEISEDEKILNSENVGFLNQEVNVSEVMSNIKIDMDKEPDETPEDLKKSEDSEEELIKPKSKAKNLEEKSQELYNEFSSFLETKADIKPEDLGEKKVIPTGIDLVDAILGGGFGVGAMNIICGSPGSCKSMLAAQTLGNGQLIYKGDLLGAFLDSEESTSSVRLSNLGVNHPKIKPYTDITIEKVFKFLEGLCLFKEQKKIIDKPAIVIWDSIANTLSQREREADDINTVIGYKARLLSILIPRYIAKLSQYNISLICVNQLREVLDMGRFGTPRSLKFLSHTKNLPGGQSLLYNSFQLLEMKIKSAIDQDKDKFNFDGVIVKVKAVKNKLFAPNIEIEVVGSFISGFSNFWTNYNFLVSTKRLKAGGWNTLITMPEKKFRTKDVVNLYDTDLVFKEEFDRLSKEAIQKDIIEKYS